MAPQTSPAPASPEPANTGRTLLLLRHGQSQWNLENRFTGWHDVGLSSQGLIEAQQAGAALAAAGMRPTVSHTSLLKRAIVTASEALAAMDRLWIPVQRNWRLNERHYGALTGLNKAETAQLHGDEQVHIWRRSYDVAPPPMEDGHPYLADMLSDERYAEVAAAAQVRTECLADVVDRIAPWWNGPVAADLASGQTVLVTAHGNSLRALVKLLDQISNDDIADLNIPTGVPLVYELGEDMMPLAKMATEQRYLQVG